MSFFWKQHAYICTLSCTLNCIVSMGSDCTHAATLCFTLAALINDVHGMHALH